MINLVITFLILIILGVLYDKYKIKESKKQEEINNDIIRKYLIGKEQYKNQLLNLNNGKPNLWIYINYEKNSRKWLNFGSRTSYKLNKPYILLTIESIIRNSAEDFNVCIIDDYSFELLIPDWSIKLDKVSNPTKSYLVNLGLMKLLYYYGGLLIPSSFITFKELYSLYDLNIKQEYNECFVCYTQDKNITSTYNKFSPNENFLGSIKENEIIKNIIQKMELLISDDYTDEQKFKGTISQYINYLVETNKMLKIEPELVGCAKYDNFNSIKEVNIEDLFSNIPIKLNKNTFGIYLSQEELSLRNKYNWIDYISIEELLNGDYNLSKYIRYGLSN